MTILAPLRAPLAALHETVQLRNAVPADIDAVGRIMFEAFRRFHESRGFPLDLPTVEAATDLAASQIADPCTYGVVAIAGGRIVGSNFLAEGDPIRAVGPISVDPDLQDTGVGRLLMQAVLKRSATAVGVRLLQDAFNTKSMALYASLGFRAREPMALMTGRPQSGLSPDLNVRPMMPADLAEADALARRVLGFARSIELRAAICRGTPVVLERGKRLVGYMTMPQMWLLNHAVAETEADLMDLILGAASRSENPMGSCCPSVGLSFCTGASGRASASSSR